MIILEIIGWIGSILYILAYFLLSYNIIEKGKLYYLINKIAAIFIIVISLFKNTFQPIVINLIWLYISYIGYNQKEISFFKINKKLLFLFNIFFAFVSILFLFFDRYLSFELLGWFSVYMFSSTYLLYSINYIEEKIFHIYNFIAAISLIPKMIVFENYQVVILEVAWAFFALQGYRKVINK